MGKAVGRWVPLSPFRLLVADLMHFSQRTPAVTADRRMDLRPLIAARAASALKPGWSTLFARAYGMLSRDTPALRRTYLELPWGRLYEHPHSVACVNLERRDGDEDIVLFCLVRGPENRSLEEIEAMVRHHREAPLETLRPYQRSMSMARVPWPFRRWVWWLSLNLFGKLRCHNYGTFSISNIGSAGAGLMNVVPALTTSFHPGMFDEHGRLDGRLTFDHRVLDGAAVARAMRDLEAILTRDLVRELEGTARAAA
ncbi:MAG: 2-oxo acid dehydrogenase subunit E2 [Gemmataceae bacterium]|nr:2-oxo acid dehydrogenase subunit E2 [Gemmataceae bacterium]